MTRSTGLLIYKKILLAEDAELLSVIKATFFGRRDFHLMTAEDAAEAFYLVEEEDPILVILDREMPGGGDNCCRRIKDDPFLRPTPVILIASDDRPSTLQECRDAGCDAILFRPLSERQLLSAACELLGLPERLDPRIPVSLPTRFGRTPETYRSGRILDLSTGGLFLETSRLVPVGRTLEVELSLPEQPKPLIIQAKVSWVNHPEWMKSDLLPVGMGLQFHDLDPQVEKVLEAYLQGRSTDDS